MRKNLTLRFLVFAFGLSYASWGIILLAQWLGWFQYGNAISILLLVIGANSPAIACYWVKKQERPGLTIRQYLKDAFAFKQSAFAYALTFLCIGAYFAVPALMGAIGSEVPPIFGGTESSAPLPLWLTVLTIPLMLFGGGAEELGWRYYLQPELEKKMPFIPASILMGLIWAVWHVPLFFIIGTAQYGTSFLEFGIMVMGLGFALAAVRRVSTGAFLCVLIHCATNSLTGTWPITGGLLVSACTAAALVAISLTVAAFGSKPAYKSLASE